VDENRRAILRTHIRPLAIDGRWIVAAPEDIEQLGEADFLRIKRHLHGFGMSGAVAADLAIGGIGLGPAGIAYLRFEDSRDLSESRFDAPETAGRECRLLRAHLSNLHRN